VASDINCDIGAKGRSSCASAGLLQPAVAAQDGGRVRTTLKSGRKSVRMVRAAVLG
jgi:hypothetical protein